MTQRRHGLNEGRADRVALTRPRPVVDPTPTPNSLTLNGTPTQKIGRSRGISMPPLAQVDRGASRKISPLQPARFDRPRIQTRGIVSDGRAFVPQ